MKNINHLFYSMCLILSFCALAKAEEWRGIIPLHSTRADVERILGPAAEPEKKHVSFHNLEKEVVSVIYASGPPCGTDGVSSWQVPKGTVVDITVSPKVNIDILFSELKVDLQGFTERKHTNLTFPMTDYINMERGIQYTVASSGILTSTTYFYTAKDSRLLHCHM